MFLSHGITYTIRLFENIFSYCIHFSQRGMLSRLYITTNGIADVLLLY